jgi:paraquat-inducible protein B
MDSKNMTDPVDHPALPQPLTSHWHGPSLVWLVPLLALVIGAVLVVRSMLATGPLIEIDFASADGLRAGQTEVRFKEVSVGKVETVTLSQDRKQVHVAVRLHRSASSFAVEDTQFWVVKPRIDLGGVSGLETLFSGAYIGVDAGISKEGRKQFSGLPTPPPFLRGEPGRGFVLKTKDLGSLDVGSPVLYRRTKVGRVVGYQLDTALDEVLVRVFIESPYESLINAKTRFWNASGVDLSLNANGLTLNTQTLGTVLSGGVTFEQSGDLSAMQHAAPDGFGFTLFSDRQTALAPPDGLPLTVRMVFDQSVRGLSVGAPIDFLGLEIGEVKSIQMRFDPARKRYPVEVLADIFPARLSEHVTSVTDQREEVLRDRNLIKRLVEHGVQAQARTGNLLTGQLYIAFDFISHTKKIVFDTAAPVPTMPTVPGTLSEVQPQLAEIVSKINKVPFDGIGQNLNRTLKQTHSTLSQLNQLSPQAQKTLTEVQRTLHKAQESMGRLDRDVLSSDAPVQRNAEQTMLDLQRAAQSLKNLTDYLERQPQSLLRGKPDDPKILPR